MKRCIHRAVLVLGAFTLLHGAALAQPKEIRVMLANHPYGELLKTAIADFEKSSGIKVNPGSAGEIVNKNVRLVADSLVVNGASTINLLTDVNRATLTSNFVGSAVATEYAISLSNAADLALNASLRSGQMLVSTGDALTIEQARFTSNLSSNRMDFLAGAGGIAIDEINALASGKVYLRTAGNVTEVSSDASLDLLNGIDWSANAREKAGRNTLPQ